MKRFPSIFLLVTSCQPPHDPGPLALGEEMHPELGGAVREPRAQHRAQGQADRRVGDSGDDAAVHDPLGIEVMVRQLEGDLGPAVANGHELHPRPLVKRRGPDAFTQILEVPLVERLLDVLVGHVSPSPVRRPYGIGGSGDTLGREGSRGWNRPRSGRPS